jgi:hypothetical protein
MPYIIALVVIVALGVGFTLLQSDKTVTTETPTPITETVTETQAPAETVDATETAAENDYKNGTHATQVTYMTPMRAEYLLDISLTLKNDIVTDADVVYSKGAEVDPNAQKFEAAYKSEVIGKDIDSLNLSRVGGASLTTTAFNEALVSIKSNAKS